MSDKRKEIEQFVKERDEMLLKCDISELRKFIAEHTEEYGLLFVNAIKYATDELLEITLHKMIVHCTNLPFDLRQKSADWLLDRGFSLNV